ncbi:MAG: hypothetical protein PHD32_04405 [Eubacteriales bacterium]|nr:hypothetical protein [Eubacteriales bacterium]
MEELQQQELRQEQTRKETDRKCPGCGAPMVFDPASGGLKCPYCDMLVPIVHTPEEQQRGVPENDIASAEKTGNHDWGVSRKTVTCKSCGAVTIYDELEVSSTCPYCGSTQVMEEKADDSLAPGGVCPFEITAQTAGENFQKWIKGKWFCPRKAKQSARPDAFQGIYLPFWTFDAGVTADYTAEYGRDRKVKDKDGNERTVTDWYPTSGVYTTSFDDKLVTGSNRHDKYDLKEIEPFHTAQSKPYRPEYVAGFGAERYSIGLEDAWKTAKDEMEGTLSGGISSQVTQRHNADHVRSVRFHSTYSGVTYKYLLLPLWLSAFQFKNKVFQFRVNGQTGAVGGKSPVSPLRVTIAVVIGVAVLALILKLLGFF